MPAIIKRTSTQKYLIFLVGVFGSVSSPKGLLRASFPPSQNPIVGVFGSVAGAKQRQNKTIMNDSQRYQQRAEWHDYTSISFYLITLRSNPDIGLLSDVVAKRSRVDFTARWIPTNVGKIAMTCIRNINKKFPWVEIIRYAVMPDHVHLLMFVKTKKDVHLGRIVSFFEGECTRILNNNISNSIPKSYYLGGYNDKIVFKENQLEVFKRYVEDNPRRLALKREHPEYFRRCQEVSIDGEYYSIYGNFLLLRHPQIVSVRFSRKFTEEEKTRRDRDIEEALRTQGVFVSPFYHRKEKEIRDKAIASGGKIIKIIPNGLSERFKPMGKDFKLCCEGRLLIIAPGLYNTRKQELTREMCLNGNLIAEKIANGAIDMRLLNP